MILGLSWAWALSTVLLQSSAAAAQQEPEAARQRATEVAPDPSLPPIHEAVLPSGLRVVMVVDTTETGRNGPTTWTLLVPGGSAADPKGREGTSALVAATMERAGAAAAAPEPPGALESDAGTTGDATRGRVLGVATSADALALTLVDSTSTPGAALELLARALTAPPPSTAPSAATSTATLDSLRSARLATVEAASATPDGVAVAHLTRALYRDHPYGRRETVESLARIAAADLQAWRAAHMRPDGAVLAVAGPFVGVDDESDSGAGAEAEPDADADAEVGANAGERAFQEVLEAVQEGLAPWLEGGGPSPEAADPGDPGIGLSTSHPPDRVLIHWPGVPEAVVQVGFPLPSAPHEDWTALAVLDGVLGDGQEGRLFMLDREEGGSIMAGTTTAAQRRRGPGLFHVRAAARVGMGPELVRALMASLASASEELPPPRELRTVQERLASGFPEQLAVPGQVAALLAVNRVLGLPDSSLVTYSRRVRRLGPQDIREVARRHLDTTRATVVVVGDATLLLPELSEQGFRLVDREGRSFSAEELEVPGPPLELDARSLPSLTLEYRVLVGRQEVGRLTRTLEPGPDSLPGTRIYRASGTLGGRDIAQSVTFRAEGLEPVAADARVSVGERSAEMAVVARQGRMVGQVTGSGARTVDLALPEDAVVGDMVELVAWLLPDREGERWRMHTVLPEQGTVEAVVYSVGPVEEVTVPAGTFPARRVDLGGGEAQTLWVRVGEGPRFPVRIQPAGQPVTLELVRVERH